MAKVLTAAEQQLWDVHFELLSGCMKANWKRFLALPSNSFEMYTLSFCCGAWKQTGKGCQWCRATALRCTLWAFVAVHESKLEKGVSDAEQQLWDVHFELLSGGVKANCKRLSVLPSKSFEIFRFKLLSGCMKARWKGLLVLPSTSFDMYALSFCRGAWKQMGNCCQCSKQQLWDVRFELLSVCVKANWKRVVSVAKQKLWHVCSVLLLRCMKRCWERLLVLPSNSFEIYALSSCRGAWKQIGKRFLVLPSKSFEMYVLSSCRGAWRQVGKGCQCRQAIAWRCTFWAFVRVQESKMERCCQA